MGDLFTNDDEEVNIFDEEQEDDSDSLEDIELSSMGLLPERFNGFLKKYPKKNIFYPKKIIAANFTKNAFDWYLKSCSSEELKDIKLDKLPDGFHEFVVKKIESGVAEPVPEKKEGSTALYIEKNAQLIKDLAASKQIAKEYINLHAEGVEYIDRYRSYLKFLYIMNGKMLQMLKTNKIPFPFAPEELDTIDEIDEVVS